MSSQLAVISQRLFVEFSPEISLAEIARVLRQCRTDLDAASPASLPELIERLARERLAARPARLDCPDSVGVRS